VQLRDRALAWGSTLSRARGGNVSSVRAFTRSRAALVSAAPAH
jgi:hypothetical protein